MNRLKQLLAHKPSGLISIYFTAGHPHLHSTVAIIQSLAAHGVDIIEVGIPFSDPMADGPVIQAAASQALRGGMNLRLLLEQVAQVRTHVPDIPLILMGYLNPIFRYGRERFFEHCSASGVDALIIPDLPFDEYLRDYQPLCRRYDIPLIMLITPETSEARIRMIDEHTEAFIYMVSAASTTGTRDSFDDQQLAYFGRINSMHLNHPRLIGFGISNATTLQAAYDHASGAIIGSLFIKCLDRNPDDIDQAVTTLFQALQ